MLISRPRQAAAGGGPSYLVTEDCEGTGTPSGWTDLGTPIDWDYTTAIEGSQSLRLNDDNARSTSPTFSATGDLWVYWKFRAANLDFNGISVFLVGPDVEIQIFGAGDNDVRVSGSVNSSLTVTKLAVDTTYEFWVHYVKGSGANALCSVAFSTDGSKPTSGDAFTSITTGTETTDVTAIRWTNEGGGAQDFRYDKMRADDANIGTSPP